MSDFQRVLVVDDGERTPDRALSAELAELGVASVTAPVDAAEDVLALISRPSAILLQLPKQARDARHSSFLELAERLKANDAGIPVIVIDPSSVSHAGGYASVLQSQFGAQAMAKPDL